MSIERLLRDEIQDEMDNLKKMELGSDQYRTTVDGVTKLTDRVIELKRLDAETHEKEKAREIETELKIEQMQEDRKNRITTHILTAAGILIPVACTIWGTQKSFEFEKEGTITTIMGRGFINKLLPKK